MHARALSDNVCAHIGKGREEGAGGQTNRPEFHSAVVSRLYPRLVRKKEIFIPNAIKHRIYYHVHHHLFILSCYLVIPLSYFSFLLAQREFADLHGRLKRISRSVRVTTFTTMDARVLENTKVSYNHYN